MPRFIPTRPNLDQLKNQAKDLLKAHGRGDSSACGTLRLLHRFAKASDEEILAAEVRLADVQFALAMDYGYETWQELKQHVGAGGRDIRAEAKLTREGNGAVIEGLEQVDWGGSFFRRQDSYMGAYTAVLQAAGEDITYEQVMGLSGAAFKLLVEQPKWHPRQAQSGIAFSCEELAREATGWPLRRISLDEEENPGAKEEARQAVVESIDRGRPVMYMAGEYSLIVGYGDGGTTYLCRPYDGGKAGYREMEVPGGMFGPAWWVDVLGDKQAPPDRQQAIAKSLQTAVELARTPGFETPFAKFASGFAAYDAWIKGLESPVDEPSGAALHANAYSYAMLLTGRAAAAEYLRSLADELGSEASGHVKEASGHLNEAAGRYERVSGRLLGGRQCVSAPWRESWTPENRAAEADIMKKNLADERRAIEEIERALALIE